MEQQVPSIIAYGYNPQTGEYTGTVNAWENPLEKGTFLLPADSTEIEPPTYQDGKIRVWNGTQWLFEDAPQTPNGGVPQTPEQLAAQLRQQRNAMLAASDYTQLQDIPISSALRAQFYTYRQLLRDLPAQPGFPENVVWPVAPTYTKA